MISQQRSQNHRWSSKQSLSCDTIIFNMFLYFQKILGLLPFTVRQSNSTRKIGDVRITTSPKLLASRFYQFYNIVLIVILIGIKIYSVPVLNKYFANGDPFIRNIGSVLILMASAVVLIIWGNVASKQNDVIKIYYRIKNVDDGMHMFRDIYHYKSTKWRICRMYILLSMMWFFYFLISFIGKHRSFSGMGISLLVPFIVSDWFVIQYASILILIEARLISLNRSFILLTKSSIGPIFCNSHKIQIHSQKSINEKFFALRQAYTIYTEICREISEYYSLPLLFITANIIGTMLYTSFSLFVLLFYSPNEVPIFSTLLRVLGLAIQMFSLVNLSTKVTNVTNEMKETSGTVYRELSQSIVSYAAKDELKKFSMELLHRKVDFTAFRLFSLDNSLIQSIFGTIVTHLVIMIQYTANKA